MVQSRALDRLLVKAEEISKQLMGFLSLLTSASHVTNDGNLHAHAIDVDQSPSMADTASS